MSFSDKLKNNIKEARLKGKNYRIFKKGKGLGSEVPSGTKADPDKIVRVVVDLSKRDGGKYYKLAQKFADIKQRKAEIEQEYADAAGKAREMVPELFSKADAVYSRAIKVADLALQVSKETETSRFDKKGFMAEIANLVPELADQLTGIEQKFTTKSARVPAVDVLGDSVTEDLKGMLSKGIAGAKKIGGKVKETFTNWIKGWDRKYEDLESRVMDAMRLPV